jgi:hypothetical protein
MAPAAAVTRDGGSSSSSQRAGCKRNAATVQRLLPGRPKRSLGTHSLPAASASLAAPIQPLRVFAARAALLRHGVCSCASLAGSTGSGACTCGSDDLQSGRANEHWWPLAGARRPFDRGTFGGVRSWLWLQASSGRGCSCQCLLNEHCSHVLVSRVTARASERPRARCQLETKPRPHSRRCHRCCRCECDQDTGSGAPMKLSSSDIWPGHDRRPDTRCQPLARDASPPSR